MSFFDDVLDVVKDVGASTTRIVTDTAIELGDVATSFQFSDEMDVAKQKLSEEGVLSAGDDIEKKRYPFLKDMQQEATAKYITVLALYKEGQRIELLRDQRADDLAEMLDDANEIAVMNAEAQRLVKQAQCISDWDRWATFLDIPERALMEMDTTVSDWNSIGIKVSKANVGVVWVASGLSVLSLAAKGVRAAKLTSKGSKFVKIEKLVSRTSGVLAVVTAGLDVELSVAELEQKKDALEENLKALNSGIAEANRDITALREETRQIGFRIYELLNSVVSHQTEASWAEWVDTTKARLEIVLDKLQRFCEIRERAIKVAKLTQGQALDDRVNMLVSVDIELAASEARKIVQQVDAGEFDSDEFDADKFNADKFDTNKFDARLAELPGVVPASRGINSLAWTIEGPGEVSVVPDANADEMTCKYSLSGPSTWTRQTWTYYARAKTTAPLSFEWKYAGFHAWFKPFLQVSVFADGPEGRQYITLLEGTQREGQGTADIVMNEGEPFGFVIKGSNYDRDSRLLGVLTLKFNV